MRGAGDLGGGGAGRGIRVGEPRQPAGDHADPEDQRAHPRHRARPEAEGAHGPRGRGDDRHGGLGGGAGGDGVEPRFELFGRHTAGRVFVQQPRDHGRQGAGVREWRGLLIPDRAQGRQDVAAVERVASLDRHVERHPERPQVRGASGRSARGALGGDEGRSADDRSRACHRRVALHGGDPEVGQHGPAARGQQHVVGFHVAVQDLDGVRGAQGRQDLGADLGGLGRGQSAALPDHLAQGARREQLHGDPRMAAILHHVVDGRHPRMADPSRGPGLPESPPEEGLLFLPCQVHRGRDLLDGDVTPEDLVIGPPDGSHTAPADRRQETVTPTDRPAPPTIIASSTRFRHAARTTRSIASHARATTPHPQRSPGGRPGWGGPVRTGTTAWPPAVRRPRATWPGRLSGRRISARCPPGAPARKW